jgi:NUMOD4 motif/HNH endonuclease
MTERWLPVCGYEGLYEVSDCGRVRSLDRIVGSSNRWGPLQRSIRGRILSPHIGSHGYLQVALGKEGQPKIHYVHRLVGEAFLGPLPPGQQTRHGPSGKLDNCLANLSYGTPEENHQDKIRDGTFRHGHITGSAHHSAKLTAAIAAECRRRNAAGEMQKVLAREFKVTQAAMSKVIRGETWRG